MFPNDDAFPVPPYADLLLRFITLRDTYASLGRVKSLNIVGDNHRAEINMEYLKGYVYVDDRTLDEDEHPMCVIVGVNSLPLTHCLDPGGHFTLVDWSAAGEPYHVLQNTNDYYDTSLPFTFYAHIANPKFFTINVKDTGIYEIDLTVNHKFDGVPNDCLCRESERGYLTDGLVLARIGINPSTVFLHPVISTSDSLLITCPYSDPSGSNSSSAGSTHVRTVARITPVIYGEHAMDNDYARGGGIGFGTGFERPHVYGEYCCAAVDDAGGVYPFDAISWRLSVVKLA